MKLYLTGATLVEVGPTPPSLRELPVRLAWPLLNAGEEKESVTSGQAERDKPGTDSAAGALGERRRPN
jgi:hypothetical protein